MDDDHQARMTLLRHELEAAAKEAAENDQLDGVGMALRAVIAHVRREGIEDPLLHLLDVRLFGALADTAVGKSHPLLERRPREKGGRPPINNEKARLMATGAAYIDRAIMAGVSETKAAKVVAEIIAPQLGADPRTGRRIGAKTMMSFRDRLRAPGAAAGNERAKAIYHMLIEKNKDYPDDEAAARLLWLLQHNTS